MQIKQALSVADAVRLSAFEGGLYVDGKRCTKKMSGRIVVRLSGATFDAASLVYYLARKIWPAVLPQFFDKNKENLALENLAICMSRSDPEVMRYQHDKNQRKEVFGSVAPYGMKQVTGFDVNPVGRPRIREKLSPEDIPGREWKKYRGHWVSVTPPEGVWDDFQLRAQKVLSEGNYLHICPITAQDA